MKKCIVIEKFFRGAWHHILTNFTFFRLYPMEFTLETSPKWISKLSLNGSCLQWQTILNKWLIRLENANVVVVAIMLRVRSTAPTLCGDEIHPPKYYIWIWCTLQMRMHILNHLDRSTFSGRKGCYCCRYGCYCWQWPLLRHSHCEFWLQTHEMCMWKSTPTVISIFDGIICTYRLTYS